MPRIRYLTECGKNLRFTRKLCEEKNTKNPEKLNLALPCIMKVVSVHENEILPKLEYFCENFQENKEVSDFRENVNVWAVSRNEISLFRANGILYPLQIMQ
jgi:hypothetical protein